MTDSQPPRPTLKLNLKPATLETLASKLPKQTVIIPDRVEPKNTEVNKSNTPSKNLSVQATVANKPLPAPPKQQKEKVDEKPQKAKKPKKEKIPPPVLESYDFGSVAK